MIAEVIINSNVKNLNKTFDYNIPFDMEEKITIGSRVLVKFGNIKKLEEGFVVNIKDSSEWENLKDISAVEEKDFIDEPKVEMAKWMANRYFCNVSDCIKLMLTPGTRNTNRQNRIDDKLINTVYLKKSVEEIEFEIETDKIKSEKQKKIIKFVKDNEGATIPEIEMFTDCSRAIINTLIKNGYLEIVQKKAERNPLLYKDIEKIKRTEKAEKLQLTDEQQNAYNEVEKCIENNVYEQFLLYGVTGSRKN